MGKKSSIKNIIMNQKYIVGVGNIYAAESLFISGIHPTKLGVDLTKYDCKHSGKGDQSCAQKIYKVRWLEYK